MATVPTALSASIGNDLGASSFNTGVRDFLNFLLKNAAYTWLVQASAQTGWTASTFTSITFTTETADNDGQHSTSSNTSRVVIGNTLGWYLVIGTYASASDASGVTRRAQVALNGTVVSGSTGITPAAGFATATAWCLVQATSSGDYVELQGWTDATTTRGTAVSGGLTSSLAAIYLRGV